MTAPPASCKGVSVSPSSKYPNPAANIGVRNVRELSLLRFPFDAK
eukprot:CAMPEP_0197848096 /NCGR_PEP_ID=MMETSP1438-20131217/7923_1 /TAXON_ID=1461541 /ORGANISM="Pterosperma sp., Strain CCMP1384" /LENGTH=44 /DNA_ID= /DNA_START= /DNA_END= /DNA_ORIENTATION=